MKEYGFVEKVSGFGDRRLKFKEARLIDFNELKTFEKYFVILLLILGFLRGFFLKFCANFSNVSS